MNIPLMLVVTWMWQIYGRYRLQTSSTMMSTHTALMQSPSWTPRAIQTSLTAAQGRGTRKEGGINIPPMSVVNWLWQIYGRYRLHQSLRLISRHTALRQSPSWTPAVNHKSLTAAENHKTRKGGGMNIPLMLVVTWMW